MRKILSILLIALIVGTAFAHQNSKHPQYDQCKAKCHHHLKGFKCPKDETYIMKKIFRAFGGYDGKEDHTVWHACFKRGEVCPFIKKQYTKSPKYPKAVTCADGYIKELRLPNKGLPGTLHPYIGCLKYLKVLDLSNNDLKGPIPSTLGLLTDSLQELNLSGNRFSCHIPKKLCNLKHIQYMDLSDNKLSGKVPQCLRKLPNLKAPVKLGCNNLQGVHKMWRCNKDCPKAEFEGCQKNCGVHKFHDKSPFHKFF
eukprot:TRINITY_DN2421_c0_g1_i1.p1 TRINITY_DN2421_c0_g1~~TRINITY_DN2421_c0_g1_i1.p1  ORF type:complete len:254 (-),score=30.85 TRINITY_DN2421_c0_g1_i1:211-972(-)